MHLKHTRTRAAACWALALATAMSPAGVMAQTALPLTGPAYTLADEAYKAYARGDYRSAADKSREALRLRPDVTRLATLLRRSEAALARPQRTAKAPPSARRSAPAATALVIPRPPAPADAPALAQGVPPATPAQTAVTQPPAAVTQPPATAAAGAEPPSPTQSPAYLAADAGYRAFERGDYGTAATYAEEAVRLAPGNAGYRQLLAQAQAGAAYDAVRRGDDAQALAAFNRADASGQLPNTAWQDAAFSAVRAGEDAVAIGFFKRTIDDVDALKLKMSPQLLFNTRRAVAEISREGGVIASLGYRGAVPGLGLAPGAASGGSSGTLQAGVETYWRPWGYRNGRYAEVFARAFETLYNKGGATGSDTLQAAVGIRYKPLAETNAVVSFSRVFAASGGRDDWLGQVAWSGGEGGDLRVDVPAWWTTRLSAEAGRYLQAGQTYALAQAQAGRSFRAGDDGNGADGRWVLYPHVALAADYDSQATERSAVGFGPGVSARYWFREDRYNAPRSYVDFTLQYRVRIAGAERARGVFLNTTLSY